MSFWKLFRRKTAPQILWRVIDFTHPIVEHWAQFDGGGVYDAMFTIRGQVHRGDQILVRLKSGRIGRFSLFSCQRDFFGLGDYRVRGCIVGYHDRPRAAETGPTTIKGLLTDGGRSLRPGLGESPNISSGFTKPASEFWKILARNEAGHARASSIRTASHL